MINACNILVENPEGRKTIGKIRRRWEINIKMELKEIGYEGVDCSEEKQLAGSCQHCNEPFGFIKRGNFLTC
jgi:hypothetical protein